MSFYTLYRRKNKKGVTTYYYRVTNPDGSRSVGHTTHERVKSRAHDYCQQLVREGRLWAGSESTFQAYASVNCWFDWDKCSYILDKRATSTEKRQGITYEVSKFFGESIDYFVTGLPPAGLPEDALAVARAAERLSPEGRRVALHQVEALAADFPLEASGVSNRA